MAVRGLGCPVRFILTAGQRGVCPQAYPLIEGLSAQVVMADAAYDADRLRQVIADIWVDGKAAPRHSAADKPQRGFSTASFDRFSFELERSSTTTAGA